MIVVTIRELAMVTYASNGLKEFYADNRFKDCLGQNQIAVVLDSGIDLDHPHFGDDKDGDKIADRLFPGKDFTLDRDNTVQDKRGHGTQVAGVIASIAPKCKILPIQIMSNKGNTDTLGIEDALKWLLANLSRYQTVTVANLSLSDAMNHTVDFVDTGKDNPEKEVLPIAQFLALRNSGVMVTASAGNYFKWYSEKGFLTGVGAYAAIKPNLGVMATDSNGIIASTSLGAFSQRRNDALAAPGNKIKLIRINKPDKTAIGRGTSYASPFLAGCCILLQSVAMKFLGEYLPPDTLESIIFDTSRDLGIVKEIDVYQAALRIGVK
jgi:subtilisin family serine protease